MQRLLLWILASPTLVLVGGCDVKDVDDRPRTLAYVTEAILEPTCAMAQCHSTFSRVKGLAFSTSDDTRATFRADLVARVPQLIIGDAPVASEAPLINVLRGVEGVQRMPLDAPMPDADISLLEDWLDRGLPGVCDATTDAPVCYQYGASIISCVEDHYEFASCATNEVCENAVCLCENLQNINGECCATGQLVKQGACCTPDAMTMVCP